MGFQKRLRSQQKSNYAMEKGVYYQAPRLFRTRPQSPPTRVSAGVKRAKARLDAVAKANKKIPEPTGNSRQVRRQEERRQQASVLSNRKTTVMQAGTPGGAAAVRK